MLAKNAVTRPMDPSVDLIQVIQGTVSRKACFLPEKTTAKQCEGRQRAEAKCGCFKMCRTGWDNFQQTIVDGTKYPPVTWLKETMTRPIPGDAWRMGHKNTYSNES